MSHDEVGDPPHGQPVTASALRQGESYFMISYLDERRLMPVMRTLIYLGKNVDGENDDSFYFQDAESFSELGPYPKNKKGKGDLYVCLDAGLSSIFELDKALKSLSRCLERRCRSKKI